MQCFMLIKLFKLVFSLPLCMPLLFRLFVFLRVLGHSASNTRVAMIVLVMFNKYAYQMSFFLFVFLPHLCVFF